MAAISAVILEPPKIKSDAVSTVSPSISHAVMGPDAMIHTINLQIKGCHLWPQLLFVELVMEDSFVF